MVTKPRHLSTVLNSKTVFPCHPLTSGRPPSGVCAAGLFVDTLEREWIHARPCGPGDSACADSADWPCLNVRCNIPNCKSLLKRILAEFVRKQWDRSSGCWFFDSPWDDLWDDVQNGCN